MHVDWPLSCVFEVGSTAQGQIFPRDLLGESLQVLPGCILVKGFRLLSQYVFKTCFDYHVIIMFDGFPFIISNYYQYHHESHDMLFLFMIAVSAFLLSL